MQCFKQNIQVRFYCGVLFSFRHPISLPRTTDTNIGPSKCLNPVWLYRSICRVIFVDLESWCIRRNFLNVSMHIGELWDLNIVECAGYCFTKGLTQNLNLHTHFKLEYNIKSLNYIQKSFRFQASFLFYWTMSFPFLTWSVV